MLSPFPSMDPYLENPSGRKAIHNSLTVALVAPLNQILPKGFAARIKEQGVRS